MEELKEELEATVIKFKKDASDEKYNSPNLESQKTAIVVKCNEIVEWINASEVGLTFCS